MNTEQQAAFLASIRANPESDIHRLAYADFLDENAGDVDCPTCGGWGTIERPDPQIPFTRESPGPDGRMMRVADLPPLNYKRAKPCDRCKGKCRVSNEYAERAELIRIMVCDKKTECGQERAIELADLVLTQVFPDAVKINRLWKYHQKWSELPWFVPSFDILRSNEPAFLFDRGFLSRVELSFDLWLKHADTILAESVGLTVKLTTRSPMPFNVESLLKLTWRDVKAWELPEPQWAAESMLDVLYGHIPYANPVPPSTLTPPAVD